jgi:hypothetical protein
MFRNLCRAGIFDKWKAIRINALFGGDARVCIAGGSVCGCKYTLRLMKEDKSRKPKKID